MFGRVPLLALFSALTLPALADDTSSSTNAAPSAVSAPTHSPIGDIGLGSDGAVKDQDSYQVRIGELNAPGGEVYIIPFLIPAVAAGQHVATAHLRFQLYAIASELGGPANADLYGIGVPLLQANFLVPSSKVRTDMETGPFIETDKGGDAALAKFLDDAFSKPENAGKYVILRISYDADTIPTGNNAYLLLTTGATGDNETPVLTYTLTSAK